MKNLSFSILCLCIWISGAPPASALDLYGAFELALENHEAVQIARESVVQSEFGIGKAYSEILPTLTLEGTYTRFSDEKTASGFLLQPEDSTRFEVRVEQPIYSGGKASSFISQAKMRLKEKQTGMDEVREEVIIITARAYYGVLRSMREVEIKEASLKRAEEQRRVAEARLKVGAATKSQLLRAEAEAAGITAELIQARALLRDAESLLRRLTGVEGPMEVSTSSYKPIEPSEGTVEEFIDLAYLNRKDYLQLKFEEEIASEGIRFAKGNFKPSLSLEGVYTFRDQNPSTTFLLNDVVFAGLTVRFPIFEGGLRRAELGEARSKLREAELLRLELKREIELQVRTTYNDMEALSSVIDSFKQQVAFSEENYEMVFKQFTFGIADSLDVIDADTTLVTAQRGLMRSTFNYELAILVLLKRTGLLLDKVENKIIREVAE